MCQAEFHDFLETPVKCDECRWHGKLRDCSTAASEAIPVCSNFRCPKCGAVITTEYGFPVLAYEAGDATIQ